MIYGLLGLGIVSLSLGIIAKEALALQKQRKKHAELSKNRESEILYVLLYEFLNYLHKHYIYKQFHNCKDIHFTMHLPRLNEP